MSGLAILRWVGATVVLMGLALFAWIALLTIVVTARGAPDDTRNALLVYAAFIYVKGLVPQMLFGFGGLAIVSRLPRFDERLSSRPGKAIGIGMCLAVAGVVVAGWILPERVFGMAPVRYESTLHCLRVAAEMTAATGAASAVAAWGLRRVFGPASVVLVACALLVTPGVARSAPPSVESAIAWQFEREVRGIRVYTRPVADSKIIAFRGEGLVRAPLDEVMAILDDPARFKDWFPDTPISFLVRRAGDVVVQYSVLDTPWPTRDRDSVFKIEIERDSEAGRVDLRIEAAPDAHPRDDDYRRVERSTGHWFFESRGDATTFVSISLHYEPGDDIPATLANMRMVEMPLEAIESLRAAAE